LIVAKAAAAAPNGGYCVPTPVLPLLPVLSVCAGGRPSAEISAARRPWTARRLPSPIGSAPSDCAGDLQAEKLEDAGEADVVLDVIGGDILDRPAALVRAGGTLVTIAMPPKAQPKQGRAVFFVVEPDRARLADLATRLRDGRLKPAVGAVRPLAQAAAALAPGKRTPGKTIIRIAEDPS
jgi:hypothetical protein